MLVNLQVEEEHGMALQAIVSQLKTLRYGRLILVVKNGEVLDLIKEERCRVSDLTSQKS